MRNAGLRGVGRRPAELLEGHFLTGHRLHDVGTGDEHVRRPLDHEHEVGHRRRIDGPSRARTHDQAELRDHSRALDVPPEDLGVAGERDHALLDPSAPGVVDPDQGAAELRGEIHDLADLLGEDLAQGTSENREVLREGKHFPAEDRSVSGDNGIPVGTALEHSEARLAMSDVAVELEERTRIEQFLHPLAREQLSLLALARNRLFAA